MNIKTMIDAMNPISFWRMDNYQNDNVFDEYGNNTLNSNGATLGVKGRDNGNFSNMAVNINGGYLDSSDYNIGNDYFAENDFALSFTFMCDEVITGVKPLVSKWFNEHQFYVGFENGDLVAKVQTDVDLIELSMTNQDILFSGRWVTVVLLLTGTTAQLAVNGLSQRTHGLYTLTTTGNGFIQYNTPLRIGGGGADVWTQDCYITDVAITKYVTGLNRFYYLFSNNKEDRFLDLNPKYYFNFVEAIQNGSKGEVKNKGWAGDHIYGYFRGSAIENFTINNWSKNNTSYNRELMVEFPAYTYFEIDDDIVLDLSSYNAHILYSRSLSSHITGYNQYYEYPYRFIGDTNAYRNELRIEYYHTVIDYKMMTTQYDGAGTSLGGTNTDTGVNITNNSTDRGVNANTISHKMGGEGVVQNTRHNYSHYTTSQWSANSATTKIGWTPPADYVWTQNRFLYTYNQPSIHYNLSFNDLCIFDRVLTIAEEDEITYPETKMLDAFIGGISSKYGTWYGSACLVNSKMNDNYNNNGMDFYSNLSGGVFGTQIDPLINRQNKWNGSYYFSLTTNYMRSNYNSTALTSNWDFVYNVYIRNMNTTSSYNAIVFSSFDNTASFETTITMNKSNGVFSYGDIQIDFIRGTPDRSFSTTSKKFKDDGFHMLSLVKVNRLRHELWIDGELDTVWIANKTIYLYHSTGAESIWHYGGPCYYNDVSMLSSGGISGFKDGFDHKSYLKLLFHGVNPTISGTTSLDNRDIPSTIYEIEYKTFQTLGSHSTDEHGDFDIEFLKDEESQSRYLVAKSDNDETSNLVIHGTYGIASDSDSTLYDPLKETMKDTIINSYPKIFYPLDDIDVGTQVTDESGNGLHGSMVGTVFETSHQGNDGDGDSKSIYFLNGSDAYVQMPTGQFYDLSNGLTMSCWVKQISTPAYIPLFVLSNSATTDVAGNIKILFNGTNIYYADGNDLQETITFDGYDTGYWCFFAFRMDTNANTIEFFVNNRKLATIAITASPLLQNRNDCRFGYCPATNYIMDDAMVSNYAIWEYPLSDEEIQRQSLRGFGYDVNTLAKYILDDKPKAYYTFDRFKDSIDEIGTYNLAVNGSVIYDRGSVIINHDIIAQNYMYNNALKINPIKRGSTIEFTFKTIASFNSSIIVSEWSNATGKGTYKFVLTPNGVLKCYVVSDNTVIESSTLYNDAKYHHVVLTINGNDIELFVDNLSQGTITLSEYIPTYNTGLNSFDITIDHNKVDEDLFDFPLLVNLGLTSGTTNFNTTAIFAMLDAVDNTRIKSVYNNPSDLIEQDKYLNYRTGITGLIPVVYWRLGDDVSLTNALDEMGAYNGTYVGTFVSSDGLLASDDDLSVTLNGTDTEITTLYAKTKQTQGTVTFIFNSTDTISNIISQDGAGDVNDVDTFIGLGTQNQQIVTNGHLTFETNGGSGTTDVNYITSTIALNDGVDHHIVLTVDGTSFKLYVDGVLNNTATSTQAGIWGADGSNILIGNSLLGAGRFTGILDELAIFDFPVTQEQVTTLYNTVVTVKPSTDLYLTQECYAEIDRWDGINSQAQLWIKVPYISKDVDTLISFSYDIANNQNTGYIGYTGDVSAKNVWSEYVAVYHLSNNVLDSGQLSLHGTSSNATTFADLGIGKGLALDGITDAVTLPEMSQGSLGTANVEISIKSNNATTLMQSYTLNGNGNANNSNLSMKANASTLNDYRFNAEHVTTDQVVDVASADVVNLHSYTMSSTQNTEIEIFRDGVSLGVESEGAGNYQTSGTFTNKLGTNNAENAEFFDGTLKEFRYSHDIKSVGWIDTNQSSISDDLVSIVDSTLVVHPASGTGFNTYGVHRFTVGGDATDDISSILEAKTWIDDLAIYDTVLDVNKIDNHYNKFIDKKNTMVNNI